MRLDRMHEASISLTYKKVESIFFESNKSDYESRGIWTPKWETRIWTVCIDHIPDNPNYQINWTEEFTMQQPGAEWYIKLYQQIWETHPYKNLHSLVIQRKDRWVRDLDG